MAYIDAGQPEAAERELRLLLRDQPSWYQAHLPWQIYCAITSVIWRR